jgi:hypothetical protein
MVFAREHAQVVNAQVVKAFDHEPITNDQQVMRKIAPKAFDHEPITNDQQVMRKIASWTELTVRDHLQLQRDLVLRLITRI